MIRNALKGTWKDTGNWLIWNVICGLLPVWGGILILKACSRSPHFSNFSQDGQFTLYSSTMLASALYILFKDYKAKFPGRSIFGLISSLGLVASVILFSVVTSADAGKTIIELDRSFIQYFSLATYVVSILIAFILTACDLHMERTSIQDERIKEIDILDEKMSKLES